VPTPTPEPIPTPAKYTTFTNMEWGLIYGAVGIGAMMIIALILYIMHKKGLNSYVIALIVLSYMANTYCGINEALITHNTTQTDNFYSKTFSLQEKEKAEIFFQEIILNRETCENIIEISVKDYLELSDKKKSFLKGYKVAVEFPEKELPMDPYMIGYWLGDGTSRDSTITSQDSTVLYYFTNIK
jgi:hypothetical protein